MARRPERLTEHKPGAGIPSVEDILRAVPTLSAITGTGQKPIAARTPAGTGFMQLALADPLVAASLFQPGIPDPTGFELDPLGRQTAFATGKLGKLPAEPVVEAPVAPAAVAAPGVTPLPTIQDIAPETVPAVGGIESRSIQELSNIASMLAPQVDAQPFTREQLVGGDVFGLTPEQVHNVTATRLGQLQTKAASDISALDFLKKSTGIDQANKLVAEKIQEEGAASRAEFIAESSAAEAAKARNRSILMEQWKAKTNLANKILVERSKAAATAAGGGNLVDIWKSKKAAIFLEFSKTNPLAAAGLTRMPDIDDSLSKLEADRAIPAGSNLKMTKAEHDLHSANVSLGVLPSDVNIEEEL